MMLHVNGNGKVIGTVARTQLSLPFVGITEFWADIVDHSGEEQAVVTVKLSERSEEVGIKPGDRLYLHMITTPHTALNLFGHEVDMASGHTLELTVPVDAFRTNAGPSDFRADAVRELSGVRDTSKKVGH